MSAALDYRSLDRPFCATKSLGARRKKKASCRVRGEGVRLELRRGLRMVWLHRSDPRAGSVARNVDVGSKLEGRHNVFLPIESLQENVKGS